MTKSDKKEVQSLTEKQIKSIPHIVASSTFEEGCRKARISRNTFYEWLKDPNFKAELQKQRDFVTDEALAVLKANITGAVGNLVGLLSSTDSDSLKRHLCNDVIKYTLKTRELEELESRLSALERTVKERLS